jgi:hypothetical protein
MQLVFLAETTNASGQHVFGHDDMRTYMPQANQHYFYDGAIQYPSANGLSLKWISEINIYTQPPPLWSIDVTGAVDTPVGQRWFENCLSCHEEAQWVDSSNNIWSGLPMWYLLALADDEYVHGSGAFNHALAEAGYDVEVRATDGYTKSFRSENISRSSGYIVANKMNGAPLPESQFPLKLVGSALTSSGQRVGKISSIKLTNIPVTQTWTIELSGANNYTISARTTTTRRYIRIRTATSGKDCLSGSSPAGSMTILSTGRVPSMISLRRLAIRSRCLLRTTLATRSPSLLSPATIISLRHTPRTVRRCRRTNTRSSWSAAT